MKKLILILATTLVLAISCNSDRDGILKVYNWSSYIDEDLIGEFEEWYKEQTGEDVEVVYSTFDINETMLSKIEKGHEDYDLVCPSDYIIERMLQSDLLLPLGDLDSLFGERTPNYTKGIAPFVIESFSKLNGSGKNANEYAVGYMWGTTGILYNKDRVEYEETTSWDIIRNPKYTDKILIKDAPRDVYYPVLIYLKRNELAEGKVTLAELMYDSSEESLAAVEAYLKEVKELVAGWEADFGKEQMTQEHAYLNLTWSGDSAWAIEEAEDVGIHLGYTVPSEGSTVWFDGFVIPKYARNIKAAKYFINFLCMPENAIRNMDYIGYVSVVGGDEVLEGMIDEDFDPVDATYFFGEAADSVCLNPVQYPDKSVIDRCEIEHDWGERTADLLAMWSRVKGNNANLWSFIIIFITIGGMIALAVIKNVRKLRRHRKKKRR